MPDSRILAELVARQNRTIRGLIIGIVVAIGTFSVLAGVGINAYRNQSVTLNDVSASLATRNKAVEALEQASRVDAQATRRTECRTAAQGDWLDDLNAALVTAGGDDPDAAKQALKQFGARPPLAAQYALCNQL